jgi:two-component system, response regulator YesN
VSQLTAWKDKAQKSKYDCRQTGTGGISVFKVMIVDDEPIFRQYMQTRLNWSELDMHVCCEAKHGIDALEQAEIHRPDIALIDINMPFMDGLQLSERLKSRFPDISIVLVTGHNEFEYARTALRIGVNDYLLKPFNNEEFLVALHKVKFFLKAIREERAMSKEHSQLLREVFLNKLISQDLSMSQQEVEMAMRRLQIPIPPTYFRIIVTEIDNMYQTWRDSSEIALWKHTVANIIRDLVTVPDEHLLFHDAEGRTISLIAFKERKDLFVFEAHAFQRLCEFVKQHFKFTLTVGIGRPSFHYHGLHLSYRDALTSIQNKLIAGQGNVIWYESLAIDQNNFVVFPVELHENLIFRLRLKDLNGVLEQLELAFSYLNTNRSTADHTYTILMGLLSLCLSFAIESGHSVGEFFGEGFSPYQEMRNMASIEQCQVWLRELFHRVILSSSGNRLSKSIKLYEAAKEFIHTNYADPDLTVEGIAGHLYIDASYLRKIFKREGDMPVSDYLTYIRMQKAKKLINGNQIKLIDIAEKTGYRDPGYFSKCFKKQFGVTPTGYENRNRT